MASLMDFLGGGMFGGADAYGSLLSDEQKKRMQQQSIMAMAAQLLQAGGPSTTRTNLGQALGGAWQAGQQAYSQAGQNALTQMLTKQKIEEYQRDKATKEKIQQYLMGGQAPAATPQDAGGLQGVIGQATPQGAMMRPGAAPAMPAAGSAAGGNKNAAIADRYRQLAMVIGPLDETKANAYLTMADKLSPQVKPVGQPFEVRNPQDPNSNILVQNYSDGTMKPVQGYSPAGMNESERLNFALNLQRFGLDKKRYDLSLKEFDRGNYERVETQEGFAWVPKSPTSNLPVIPITTAGSQQPGAAQPGAAQPGATQPGAAQLRGKPSAEYAKTSKALSDLEGTLAEFEKDVRSTDLSGAGFVVPSKFPLPFGASIPNPLAQESSAAMTAKYTATLMGLKELFNLGVIAGPDMEIITSMLTNPASFEGMFKSREAMAAQVDVVKNILKRAKDNLNISHGLQPQSSFSTPSNAPSIGNSAFMNALAAEEKRRAEQRRQGNN